MPHIGAGVGATLGASHRRWQVRYPSWYSGYVTKTFDRKSDAEEFIRGLKPEYRKKATLKQV